MGALRSERNTYATRPTSKKEKASMRKLEPDLKATQKVGELPVWLSLLSLLWSAWVVHQCYGGVVLWFIKGVILRNSN